tara:strand:- start:1461 stop:1685 length:225 start_codon:yes stop_codon:yes gene_type:complete
MHNIMSTSKFSKIITDIVEEKNITYMDAIMDYCYKNQLEVESAAKLINQKIKKQIKEEATKLNFIKPESNEEHL